MYSATLVSAQVELILQYCMSILLYFHVSISICYIVIIHCDSYLYCIKSFSN